MHNIDDAPTVVLLKAGEDVCAVCARTAAGIREPACCTSLLRIVTQEEVPIVFGGEGGAILLDSPEFLNFDFPTLDFFVSVAVPKPYTLNPKP